MMNVSFFMKMMEKERKVLIKREKKLVKLTAGSFLMTNAQTKIVSFSTMRRNWKKERKILVDRIKKILVKLIASSI